VNRDFTNISSKKTYNFLSIPNKIKQSKNLFPTILTRKKKLFCLAYKKKDKSGEERKEDLGKRDENMVELWEMEHHDCSRDPELYGK
jgi:hypothetical protein